MEIKSNFRRLREASGMTRAQTARAVGVHWHTIRRWDKDCSNMLLVHASKCARAFECKIDHFVEVEE